MANSNDVPADVEAEIKRVLESMPPEGITEGTSEIRMTSLAAATAIKARHPEHPVLIGEPNDQNVVLIRIGAVPVVTKFES